MYWPILWAFSEMVSLYLLLLNHEVTGTKARRIARRFRLMQKERVILGNYIRDTV